MAVDNNMLSKVWQKVFSLIKTITGDVDVKNKGTLQYQIDNMGTGKGAKEISWAEYNALPDEEKNNGTLYAIPDAPFVSDLTIQAMTLEMYEALTEEEKMDDTVRFISDATFFADGDMIIAFDVIDGILVATYDDGKESVTNG